MNRNDWITTASWWLTSAPCLSSCWTISTCPSAAARCNGVALACLNQYQLIRDDVIWYYAPIKYQILRELGKQLWIQKIIMSSPIHRPMFGHSRGILKSYGAFLFIFFKQFKKKKKILAKRSIFKCGIKRRWSGWKQKKNFWSIIEDASTFLMNSIESIKWQFAYS